MTATEIRYHVLRKIEAIIDVATRLSVDIDLVPWVKVVSESEDRFMETPAYFTLLLYAYGKVKFDACSQEATVHLNARKSEDITRLRCRMETHVSWSSTTRTVSQAYLSIRLYERAIEFAAAVEGIWNT